MEVQWARNHPVLHNFFKTVVHIVGFLNSGPSTAEHFYYQRQYKRRYELFAYSMKYLTIWASIIQTIYFFLCCLSDFLERRVSNDTLNQIVKVKDFIGCSLAFPTAFFVSLMFWGLKFIDENLVFPPIQPDDPIVPRYLTHSLHTNVIIIQIADIMSSPKKYPSTKHGLLSLNLFTLIYIIWVYIIERETNEWVYPVFARFGSLTRLAVMATGGAGFCMSYFVGKKLNDLLWQTAEERTILVGVVANAKEPNTNRSQK